MLHQRFVEEMLARRMPTSAKQPEQCANSFPIQIYGYDRDYRRYRPSPGAKGRQKTNFNNKYLLKTNILHEFK